MPIDFPWTPSSLHNRKIWWTSCQIQRKASASLCIRTCCFKRNVKYRCNYKSMKTLGNENLIWEKIFKFSLSLSLSFFFLLLSRKSGWVNEIYKVKTITKVFCAVAGSEKKKATHAVWVREMTHFDTLVRGSRISLPFHLCFWLLPKIVIIWIILLMLFSYILFQIPYILLILSSVS